MSFLFATLLLASDENRHISMSFLCVFVKATVLLHNLWLYSDVHIYCVPKQISELSVDVEGKQKELQSVHQDKSCLEQQLTSLVRKDQSQYNQ